MFKSVTQASSAPRLKRRVSALVVAGAFAGTAAFGFGSAALAQGTSTSAASQPKSEIPVIHVTAEFRKENLQRTPLAITAVNAAMLAARGQTNVVQIAAEAPNVTLTPRGQAFGSAMVASIRGIGQTDFDYATEPGVAIYVDDVYYSTITGNMLDLLDLDRVEVLRGPQGTLAGKNAIGGAIKLYTKKPDGNNGGWIEGTYGSLDTVGVRGSADFTIVPDKLFVRFSGASKTHDGYVKVLDYACVHPGSGLPQLNVGRGCQTGTQGGQSFTAGRVAVRWTPNDKWDINISGDIDNDRSEINPGVLMRVTEYDSSFIHTGALSVSGVPMFYDVNHNGIPNLGNCDAGGGVAGGICAGATDVPYDNRFVAYGPYRGDKAVNNGYVTYANYIDNNNGVPASGIISGCAGPAANPPGCTNALTQYKPVVVPPINHFKSWGLAANIDWQILDNLQLQSITSYRYYLNSFANDDDASPIAVQELLQTLNHRQVSQEVRLNGSFFNHWLEYTVGGFYHDQPIASLQARVDLPYTAFDFQHGPDTTPTKTEAVYGNLTAHPTNKLTVSAGVRFSHDDKVYTFHRHNPDGTLPTVACTSAPWFAGQAANCAVAGLEGLKSRFSGDRWDYRFVADYQLTPNFMGYAQIATGYKGGGVNARPFVPAQLLPLAPETLTAYEAGIKSTWFGKVRFNAAYFFNLYDNIQLIRTNCASITPYAPTCLLPFNGGDAHVWGLEGELEAHPTDAIEMDASISYIHFKYQRIAPSILNAAEGPVTYGMTTPYTPSVKWSIGAQYRFDLPSGWGSITPRIDASYQSHEYTYASNAPTNFIDGYTLENAHLTWKSENDLWEAALKITNLSDEYYILSINDLSTSAGFVTGQPGMPREWSFSLKRKF